MDPKGSASNVEKFSRQLREAGFSLERHTIQFFTFVPDPTGYIAVVHDKDGSMSRCAWTNVPHRLSQLLESNANNGIRLVTVGKNGSYVVILDTGAMWWSGVPGPLSRLLEDARREGRVVTTVSLSLIADTWYFIAFADGGTRFALPPDWHDSINRHTDDAKETPSDNRASSSSSPRAQQPASTQEVVYTPRKPVGTQQPAYTEELVYTPRKAIGLQQPANSQEPLYAPQVSVATQQPAYSQKPAYSPQLSVVTQQPAYLQEPVYAPQVPVVTQQPAYAPEPVFNPQALVDTQQPAYLHEPVYAPQVPVVTQLPAYAQEPVYARQPSYPASVSSGPTPEQPRGRSTTMEDIVAFIQLVRKVVKLVRKVVKLVGAIRDAT